MRPPVSLLGLPLVALLAGCGSSGSVLTAPPPASAPAVAAPAPDVRVEPAPHPPPLTMPALKPTKQALEDTCRVPAGESCAVFAMDHFYEKLLHTLRKEPGAITRITHFGDSIVASDYVSATIRRRLVSVFGDAGRGFVFTGAPEFYQLDGLTHTATGWQSKSLVTGFVKDHLYGFGNAFTAPGPNALASFIQVPSAKVSNATVFYLTQPGAGSFELQSDGDTIGTQEAHGEIVAAKACSFEVEEGPHKIRLKTLSGPLRVFGVALENDGPGVVYDAIGQIGNTVFAMLKNDGDHFEEVLALRNPDLVIVHLGANDTGFVSSVPKTQEDYTSKKREFLRRVRGGAPEASCLLIGPQDGPRPSFLFVIDTQRALAHEFGCAFWDTRSYMGGKDSLKLWQQRGHIASDGIHPTPKGADLIGDGAGAALLQGFVEYAERNGIPVRYEP